MAVVPIPITYPAFQGKANFSSLFLPASTDMRFVNDGYTVIYVRKNGATSPTLTITSIPDNAARLGNIVYTFDGNRTVSFGPFRPVFWNRDGFVSISVTDATHLTICAISYQF